ncbi:hypothetical protein MAPG_08392 [Magnaporthiopsis poae ATCC 64411]|uniref:AT hook domain-containing protein n=1 Tax=Magnaporthiopsis poae (strain ATCC 64411 / 73-15) TaxID=644358 RepID=A0A0C4E788_MAGP6|nr:hypothetical protein MAPG_08392 [Magnaporthiopsis poae ATCC 64411]
MPTRRVIEDSDDDGSDFSPPRSPAYSLLTDVADRDHDHHHVADAHATAGPALPDGAGGLPQASRSGSTDPAFFERVYQEQSRTVEALEGAGLPQAEATSSITDPTVGSRGRRRTNSRAAAVRGSESSQAGGGEDVDLVIIPRSGDRIPPSGAGSDATSAPGQTQIRETQNARIEVTLPQTLSSSQKQAYKVFSLSSEPSPEYDGSSLPNRLNPSGQKSSGAVSTPTHIASSCIRVDGSDLPSTAEVPPPPSTNKRGRKRKSNPVPTSSPDIFAEEDTRTSKKAKKFIYYDDSWEPKAGRGDVAKITERSSRTRSSAATDGLPDTQIPGALLDTQAPGTLPDTQPFGALPDTQPPGVIRSKETAERPPDAHSLLPGLTNQTTEQDRAPQDEPTPESSDKHRGPGTDPVLVMSSDEETGPSRVPEKTAKPQKKRGRKKKEVAKPPEPAAAPAEPTTGDDVTYKSSESAEIFEQIDAAPASVPEPPPIEAPPKKKRGRPKAENATQDVDKTPVVEAEASSKKKRGRPKKSAAKAAEPAAKEEAATESGHAAVLSPPTDTTDHAATRALSEASDGNSQKKTATAFVESPEGANSGSGSGRASTDLTGKGKENGDLYDDSKDSAAATPAKAVQKETAAATAATTKPAGTGNGCSPAGQAGKVTYRVGLSKRSRIAPLLKSLRK